jgi:hypothetical protein
MSGHTSCLSIARNRESTVLRKVSYHSARKAELNPLKEKETEAENNDDPVPDEETSCILYTVPIVKKKIHSNIKIYGEIIKEESFNSSNSVSDSPFIHSVVER